MRLAECALNARQKKEAGLPLLPFSELWRGVPRGWGAGGGGGGGRLSTSSWESIVFHLLKGIWFIFPCWF